MTRTKKSTIERVKDLLALRRELDDRVGSKADVVGSMVGLKFQAGMLTRRLGITYFVHEKIPRSELSPRHRVPKMPRVGGQIVTTDVLAWPPMIEQALPQGTILFDGRLQGTLSCFGLSDAGFFGVSCAHCLAGIDGNPATPTSVLAYANPPGQFLPVGQSVFSAYSPGSGIQGSFGYLDCGLFDMRDQILSARATAGHVINVVDDINTLVGHNLVGVSALNAPGSNISMREATVAGVEAVALGERCDVVLNVRFPGTFKGDSGMLWLTEDGQAAAIHARGEIMGDLQGSQITTAMAAKRVSEALSVQLLIG